MPLTGDDAARLPVAIGLSRPARCVIRQHLWITRRVIGGPVAATLGGFASIARPVLAQDGGTLVEIMNALGLLRYNAR